MKKIYIYTNNNSKSKYLSEQLFDLLRIEGFDPTAIWSPDAEFALAIGGDGAMLRTLKATGFAPVPTLGINTGHLGFFPELGPEELDKLVEILKTGNYVTQEYRTIRTTVESNGEVTELAPAINDVLVRHWFTSMIHLDISIGGTLIETFSGDGVIIASSSGSTAYNYSLGGSIVDPRLALLQVTPVAPANNAMYRSFTSSILLPPEQEIVIRPEDDGDGIIVVDGDDHFFERIDKVTVGLSPNIVKIVRLPGYDFWSKVKSKFL